MAIINHNEGIIECGYFWHHKFPYQVAFVPSKKDPYFSFNTKFYIKVVIPWLQECIGEYGVDWENIHDYKKVAEKADMAVWYHAFNFLTKEDAVLFRLTWG